MRDWITEDEVIAFGRAALEAGARSDGRDDILKSTPRGWACRWGRINLSDYSGHGAVLKKKTPNPGRNHQPGRERWVITKLFPCSASNPDLILGS